MTAVKKMKKGRVESIESPQSFGLGLDGIGDLSGLLDDPEHDAVGDGRRTIALELIDEDPNQPRHADNPGFSRESLSELAMTIKERGVKTPISVRVHPDADGRFIINHGARRYRASKLAGKDSIPAIIDNDYNEIDQVIENLQRNDLTPREIADFIGRELARGKKKVAIAKELGKSPAFVTQHATLLDLPDPIGEAFQSGRTNDVTLINELVKAYKVNEEAVTVWLEDDNQEVTRGSVKVLREVIEEDSSKEDHVNGEDTAPLEKEKSETEVATKESDPHKLKKAIVQVRHDGRLARLLLSKRPPTHGEVWLKYEDDGQEVSTEVTAVDLVAVLEG